MTGSSGKALGIIGIILGAAGLGFGLLSWINIIQTPTQGSWHDYTESSSLSLNRVQIYELSISMTLGAGQAIYVSFSCRVSCHGVRDTFYIYIDDIYTGAQTWVSRDSAVGWEYLFASMQHVNNTVASGAHTVSVWAETDDPGSSVSDCLLFVQTI